MRSGIPWWYGGCYGTGNVFCMYSGAERGVFRAWGPCICQNLILVHSPISRISEDPTLGGWFSELRKYFWSGFVLNHNFRTRSVRLAGFYCLNRHYMIRADLRIDSPPPLRWVLKSPSSYMDRAENFPRKFYPREKFPEISPNFRLFVSICGEFSFKYSVFSVFPSDSSKFPQIVQKLSNFPDFFHPRG